MRNAGAQARTYVITTLALVVVALATLVGADRFGEASRRYGAARPAGEAPRVLIARDARHAVSLWRDSGMRGRVLVHFGEFLHFVEPATQYPQRALDRFPYGVEEAMAGHAGDPGMLWVLMRVNVARELVNVLPPPVYTGKVGQGGEPGARATTVSSYGLRRTIADHVVPVGEPVLVSVDASLFGSAEGRALADALRRSALRTDLVVCNLAEDNPRVDEASRDLLRRFARELGATP